MTKLYTLKVKKNVLDKLKLLQLKYDLSSLNDTLLLIITKYEVCEKGEAYENSEY